MVRANLPNGRTHPADMGLTVTLAASGLFILFGIVYFYEAFLSIDPDKADLHPLSP